MTAAALALAAAMACWLLIRPSETAPHAHEQQLIAAKRSATSMASLAECVVPPPDGARASCHQRFRPQVAGRKPPRGGALG
jgi:hypothetical protein